MRTDPVEFLERFLGTSVKQRQEALFRCPFCNHHKPKLSFNVELQFWKCWVCDKKGRSLFGLVSQIGNPGALVSLRREFSPSYVSDSPVEHEDFVLQLPDEYEPLYNISNTFHGKRATRYLANRKVGRAAILRHKLGYVATGEWADRIIFPSFDIDGNLNFFTGRTISNHPQKYYNPMTPRGYKNTVIFNELNTDWKKPVMLVEGFMDMLATDNAIPLFGSTIPCDSKLFFQLVMEQPQVYVCLDADARKKQIRLLEALYSYGVNCFDFDVRPHKDLSEMPTSSFAAKLQQAAQVDTMYLMRQKVRERLC